MEIKLARLLFRIILMATASGMFILGADLPIDFPHQVIVCTLTFLSGYWLMDFYADYLHYIKTQEKKDE